jgi:hypothetical protein
MELLCRHNLGMISDPPMQNRHMRQHVARRIVADP